MNNFISVEHTQPQNIYAESLIQAKTDLSGELYHFTYKEKEENKTEIWWDHIGLTLESWRASVFTHKFGAILRVPTLSSGLQLWLKDELRDFNSGISDESLALAQKRINRHLQNKFDAVFYAGDPLIDAYNIVHNRELHGGLMRIAGVSRSAVNQSITVFVKAAMRIIREMAHVTQTKYFSNPQRRFFNPMLAPFRQYQVNQSAAEKAIRDALKAETKAAKKAARMRAMKNTAQKNRWKKKMQEKARLQKVQLRIQNQSAQ